MWAIATRLPAAALPAEADQAWPWLISRYDGPGPTLQFGPGLARQVDADVDQYPGELASDVAGAGFVEQQRPQQVTSGLLGGLRSRLPVLALAGTGLWVRLRSRGTPTS